jgi:UDP-N-acetylglucosamine transferase subunit ALG13/ubiquinone/menaquinone biosynthesis C-methylase UbiE
MILVSVGSAPQDFSRLTRAAEEIAKNSLEEVVVQTGYSTFELKKAKSFRFVSYTKMRAYFQNASLIISHASAGPILFAQEFHKPLILFPRSGERGEHIDNHQMEFAKQYEDGTAGIQVVYDVSQLPEAIENAKKHRFFPRANEKAADLILYLRNYLSEVERQKKPKRKFNILRFMKQLLFKMKLYRPLSDLWNQTFWILRKQRTPKDFWNSWSPHFFNQKIRHKTGLSHEWLIEQLNARRAGKVLEAGCSFGRTLKYLDSKVTSRWSFYGVDLSFQMLHHAKSYLKEAIGDHLACSKVESLPFADKSFDLVFTHGTLIHLPEDALFRALSELERVSKGDLILVEETSWEPGNEVFQPNAYTYLHNFAQAVKKQGWTIKSSKQIEEAAALLICLSCEKKEKGSKTEKKESFLRFAADNHQ